jgi:hypothetical protein
MSTVTLEEVSSTTLRTRSSADGQLGRHGHARLFARVPASVFVVAVLAGLLHIAPVWRAQLQTPPGWTFTGNLTLSPDYMQYRVWDRLSLGSGPVVADSFTAEPNRPHLLVPFYYVIGQISLRSGWPPEFVYDYLGSLLAFALAVLLFVTIRFFLNGSPRQTWWVFVATLVGGGLGGHLKLLSNLPVLSTLTPINAILVSATRAWPLWEDYRSHYIFVTLFDTHFLMVWLLTTAAVVSLYFTLARCTLPRLTLMLALFAATTLFHVYEGITLLAITGAVALLCWRKGVARRSLIVVVVTVTVVVGLCLVGIGLLYVTSGLPSPTWRGVNILFATVLIAYPLAWPLIAWGLPEYWRKASLRECFLLGWALGCTALTLSGPFYPYPDRGTMTLQIPLCVIAGAIYFSRRVRVSRLAIGLAVVLLAATPAFMLARQWTDTAFNPQYPFMFLDGAHTEISRVLDQRASTNDVLLEEQSDALWLAPEYPGKHFAAHFFLTVDYAQKESEIDHFFDGAAADQVVFLEQHHIRFLYVASSRQPERFAQVPGLSLLSATSAGSLFEFMPATADATG